MAQCVVHALKGLTCHACHSSKLACLALQAVLSAHVAFVPRARLRQSYSRTLTSQKHNESMGPKLRYPTVADKGP